MPSRSSCPSSSATRKPTAFPPPRPKPTAVAAAGAARVIPIGYGNGPGTNLKLNPQRSAGDHYTALSYCRAIARACDQAFPPPEHLAKLPNKTTLKWRHRLAWRKRHRWHPHQLRHNAATELRKEFGIEAARIILGHRSAAITEVYAEKNEQQAIEAITRVG